MDDNANEEACNVNRDLKDTSMQIEDSAMELDRTENSDFIADTTDNPSRTNDNQTSHNREEVKEEEVKESVKDEASCSHAAGDSGIFDVSPQSMESKEDGKSATDAETSASLKRSKDSEKESGNVRFKKIKKGSRKFRSKKAEEAAAESSDSENEPDISTRSSPHSSSSSDSSSDSSSTESEEERGAENKPELSDDEQWLKKDVTELSKNNFVMCKEFINREKGSPTYKFTQKVCSSRYMCTRLRKQHTLNGHEGCVNSLNFNESGTLLASGSDDLMIKIWNWELSKDPVVSYESGHRANVFQSKFLPGCHDATIVSCARDGQVRVADISSTGTCRATKKVAQHRGSAHKLATDSGGSKTLFYSCGEDGDVYRIDLRDEKPATKILSVKHKSEKVALYSIHVNPRNEHEFALSGRDQWARIYDQRKINQIDDMPLKKFCPHHLIKKKSFKTNITCLMYNFDGSELLCSYNDEDIYLFDTTHSSGDEYKRKYKGHRNNATVKGVNFYGPRSEFVVSGSDCGNVFLWEKDTSQIVQFMEGDEEGVVNVLEPHPHLPVLATSGLDNNVKIFSPIGEAIDDFPNLREKVLSNRHERYEESYSSQIDGQLLWFLMRSLQTRMRRDTSGERSRNMPYSALQALSEDSSDEVDDNSSNDSEEDQQDPCVTS